MLSDSIASMEIDWKVPYLPEDKKIFVVPVSNEFMMEAMRVRDDLSTDLNHSTGAVVVKDGKILGFAANQAGFKIPALIELHRKGACVRKVLKVKSGTKYWLCPGCATHEDHAESGAVRDAIEKAGAEAVRGASVFLYGHFWCCKPCWDTMLAAGIGDVFVVEGAYSLFNKKK